MARPTGPEPEPDITEAQVAEAWRLRGRGTSILTIAEKLGLTEEAVHAALARARVRELPALLARLPALFTRVEAACVEAGIVTRPRSRRRRPPSR
jgi:hypothetical protein